MSILCDVISSNTKTKYEFLSCITLYENDRNYNTLDQLKEAKGQKFLFLNIRSVFNHISEIQADFNGTNFTAIGLVRTWLTANLLSSMIAIDGYKPSD